MKNWSESSNYIDDFSNILRIITEVENSNTHRIGEVSIKLGY